MIKAAATQRSLQACTSDTACALGAYATGFNLTYIGNFQNAYEGSYLGCSQDMTFECCSLTNTSYRLFKNSTTYSAYQIGSAQDTAALSLGVHQGNESSLAVCAFPDGVLLGETPVNDSGTTCTALISGRTPLNVTPVADYLLFAANAFTEGAFLLQIIRKLVEG